MASALYYSFIPQGFKSCSSSLASKNLRRVETGNCVRVLEYERADIKETKY